MTTCCAVIPGEFDAVHKFQKFLVTNEEPDFPILPVAAPQKTRLVISVNTEERRVGLVM